MGLSRNMGVNFPLLTIYTLLGMDVDICRQNYAIEVDRTFINRYEIGQDYSAVYVDLDDTLELGNKVNQWLLLFLYQCVNSGKKLYLLTRHARTVAETLKSHRLSEKLFDKIIHIKDDTKNPTILKKKSAIFLLMILSGSARTFCKNCGINVFLILMRLMRLSIARIFATIKKICFSSCLQAAAV